MDISQRDKVMLIVGAAIGVIIIGIALEGVQTYAASKEDGVWIEFLRSRANEGMSNATPIGGNGRPTAVPASSLAGATGSITDTMEPAYTNNGISEEFRVSE